MGGSGLEVSLGKQYGRVSLRGVYLDIALLLMSRMATSELCLHLQGSTAHLGILFEVV